MAKLAKGVEKVTKSSCVFRRLIWMWRPPTAFKGYAPYPYPLNPLNLPNYRTKTLHLDRVIKAYSLFSARNFKPTNRFCCTDGNAAELVSFCGEMTSSLDKPNLT